MVLATAGCETITSCTSIGRSMIIDLLRVRLTDWVEPKALELTRRCVGSAAWAWLKPNGMSPMAAPSAAAASIMRSVAESRPRGRRAVRAEDIT